MTCISTDICEGSDGCNMNMKEIRSILKNLLWEKRKDESASAKNEIVNKINVFVPWIITCKFSSKVENWQGVLAISYHNLSHSLHFFYQIFSLSLFTFLTLIFLFLDFTYLFPRFLYFSYLFSLSHPLYSFHFTYHFYSLCLFTFLHIPLSLFTFCPVSPLFLFLHFYISLFLSSLFSLCLLSFSLYTLTYPSSSLHFSPRVSSPLFTLLHITLPPITFVFTSFHFIHNISCWFSLWWLFPWN